VTDGYDVARISDLELPQSGGQGVWATVRSHFDIQSFGVNAWGADEPGGQVIGEHDEASSNGARHEELYVVLSGRATFTVDGETVDGTPGTLVFVRDPEVKRQAVAAEPGTRVLALGARRGEVFTPSQWERSAPALSLFASAEYQRALELLEQQLAKYPDDPVVAYNVACAESRVGRKDDAVEHLRLAISGRENLRELAKGDDDLEALRDEPAFRELVG
jgi:tetratricopeptide (TPR) repeat protein